MVLISPGRENLLDFLKLRQVLSTHDGALRDPLWWPQERPVPMQVVRDLSGFLSRRCRGQGLVWSRFRNLRISLQC